MSRPSLAFPAAVAGTVDAALFLLHRPALFRSAPGRAFGSVAFLALWMTLAARTAYEGNDRPASPTLALSGAAFTGNLAMLAVHLRHRVAGPRVFVGAALSGVALADCLRRRQNAG
jgi:hypothetical protein